MVIIMAVFAFCYYFLLPVWVVYRWFRFGRDPVVNANVSITYDPPKNKAGRALKPAEVGTLIDESVVTTAISLSRSLIWPSEVI